MNEVTDAGAVVTLPNGNEKTIPADTVIMSIGYRPLPSFAEKLSGCNAKIYEIGDGSKVGNVLTCIRDAYQVARKI